MAQQYSQTMVQKLPSACVIDLTPPTFLGISALTPQAMGSLKVDHLGAVDPTGPINYEIYCLPGAVVAATLFASQPCQIVRGLTGYVFMDANGDFIVKGTTYTVGVRARDAQGNLNTNTAILTTVAIGSANLAQIFQDLQTDFAASEAALASDAASIAASAITLQQAAESFPDVNASYGVVEAEEIIATAGDDDELTLALSGGGVGFNGNEVVLYHTITAGEITAKELTLPSLPQDVTEVKVDWISVGPQVFGVDFTVSGTTLSWDTLGLDTEGLSSGDKLRIVYLSQ